MESVASREQKELLRRQAIQQQIAQLQAQLLDPSAPSYAHPPEHGHGIENVKRKQSNVTVLAPASPEHKRRRVTPSMLPNKPDRSTDQHKDGDHLGKSGASNRSIASSTALPCPGPSNVLSKLSTLSKRAPEVAEPDVSVRTSSFADKSSGVATRDDRLALIEEFEPGPYEHKPLSDDPLFERFEPHSSIRLASRKLPHEDLQAYMTGRYYISPSRLYSVVRAQPGPGAGTQRQVYDVPVVGDWVTIAVVAERSPIRVSRAPVTLGPGEARDADDLDPTTASSSTVARQNSKSGKKDPPPRAGRKYVNLTLIDFGAGGKKGTSRGDAALSLLLFESDTYDTVSRGDGLLPEKIYKGGSRGAFESMAKLREGTVIALLNPRVLKSLQKSGAPNVLALTPESAASVAVIGTANDLGMCGVVKRDGKPCGSWCDKRVSEVCDYHLQHAIERRRAGRAEFSTGTSGMSIGSGSQRRKAAYDPQRKWGLSPADGSAAPSSAVDGATYVVAGHVVAAGKRDLFLNETVGREAQARAARQASSRDTDRTLKRLLARDGEGMKFVQEARRFAKKERAKRITDGKPLGSQGLSRNEKRRKGDVGDGWSGSEEECEGDGPLPDKPTKNAYSAQVIKRIGFDPTLQSSRGRRGDDDPANHYSKLMELASCRAPDKISLGHRPGGRVRSVVSAPKNQSGGDRGGFGDSRMSPDPDGEDDLDIFKREVSFEGHTSMVDLDESSDDELVVEPPGAS